MSVHGPLPSAAYDCTCLQCEALRSEYRAFWRPRQAALSSALGAHEPPSCAWCLDPGCSGKPCRHTEAIALAEQAYNEPALVGDDGAIVAVVQPSAPPAAISAWTVCEEERAGWTR